MASYSTTKFDLRIKGFSLQATGDILQKCNFRFNISKYYLSIIYARKSEILNYLYNFVDVLNCFWLFIIEINKKGKRIYKRICYESFNKSAVLFSLVFNILSLYEVKKLINFTPHFLKGVIGITFR
ncbi:hypothetical protein A4G18_05790 [Pasteurellaceae bacterium Pebbles2]|nr:hypothetical protein [Pasteurellaceae bacterium Pebbles2]